MRPYRVLAKAVVPVGLMGLLAIACAQGQSTTQPASAENAAASQYEGITKASERRQFSIDLSHRIAKVTVKEGDHVKVGQELIVADARDEELRWEIYKIEANSDIAINAAIVTRDNKKVEFERVKDMHDKKVASDSEFDKARLDVALAELDIDKARMEKSEKVLQAQQQRALLDRMSIVSKIDGIVKEIALKEGEVVDPTKPVITVVKNDPLWVEVYLPTSISLALKTKDAKSLNVSYADEKKPRAAKIIFFDPEADPAADVQRIRLELPNPEDRPSGLKIQVAVPPGFKGADVAVKSE